MTKAEERFEGWQERAGNDEQAIVNLLQAGGPWSTVCFLAQQMAEKYLKGWLVYNKQRFEKTHLLADLLQAASEIDSSFATCEEAALVLTSYYTDTRYPADLPEYTERDAREALEAAQSIKDFVLERVG